MLWVSKFLNHMMKIFLLFKFYVKPIFLDSKTLTLLFLAVSKLWILIFAKLIIFQGCHFSKLSFDSVKMAAVFFWNSKNYLVCSIKLISRKIWVTGKILKFVISKYLSILILASSWPPQNIPLAVPGDKKKKPGIIYLSSIPPGFNVSCTIAFFSQFGKVGRVFLQPGKF